MKLYSLIFSLSSAIAIAQVPIAEISNATLVGPEGIVITAISSPTAVLQFGIGSTWCSTITAPKLPLIVSYSTPNLALCPFDPAKNNIKSIVAQQQVTSYTITYTTGKTSTVVTIPALTPAVPITNKSWLVTCTGVLTMSNSTPIISNSNCTAVAQ
jgi:hypothetical protein